MRTNSASLLARIDFVSTIAVVSRLRDSLKAIADAVYRLYVELWTVDITGKSPQRRLVDMPLERLRSLDDFLVGGARYQAPNFRDLEKWNNRIVQNLIYYQTNYFVLGALLVVLLGLVAPQRTLEIALTLSVPLVTAYVFLLAGMPATGTVIAASPLDALLVRCRVAFRRRCALPSRLLVQIASGTAVLMLYWEGNLARMLLMVLLPMFAALVHASLRLRNVQNKVVNLLTGAHRSTPMGELIAWLDALVGGALSAIAARNK